MVAMVSDQELVAPPPEADMRSVCCIGAPSLARRSACNHIINHTFLAKTCECSQILAEMLEQRADVHLVLGTPITASVENEMLPSQCCVSLLIAKQISDSGGIPNHVMAQREPQVHQGAGGAPGSPGRRWGGASSRLAGGGCAAAASGPRSDIMRRS